MNQDKQTQAMVAGRQNTAQRVVWQLTVEPCRFRCIAKKEGKLGDAFEVQTRLENGWTKTRATGADPFALLELVVDSKAVRDLVLLCCPQTGERR